MKTRRKVLTLLLVFPLMLSVLSACAAPVDTAHGAPEEQAEETELDTSRFLAAVEDEPDTVDFQCTSIYYTVATNVFNRLVEMEADTDGAVRIVPSLAENWEVSEDGCGYTFHLRENVRFSNGSPLTASDVLYTFTRLLTHPDSCNRDIADEIVGASALSNGEADRLDGFQLLGKALPINAMGQDLILRRTKLIASGFDERLFVHESQQIL